MNYQEIPKDEALQTAYWAYKPSDQTIALKSEQNRLIFAENFNTTRVLPLNTLCLIFLAQNYQTHPINLPSKISAIQLRTFYDFIDENIPIEKCININDEYFWKRLYSAKCTDKMLIKKRGQQKDVSWKNLSITLKYIELIENTPYEVWITEEMEEITKNSSPYVTELIIKQLQAKRDSSFKKQTEGSRSSVSEKSSSTLTDEETKDSDSKSNNIREDFPLEDCHHVDLSILGSLCNLTSLNIAFAPPKLDRNYHDRFFNFSYVDIQNLARGISELKNLRVFKLRGSRMDSIKFSTILEALQTIFVEELEFFFCQLDDNCGEALYKYLLSTKTLNHLDLTGNYFKDKTIDYLSDGLKRSYSKLTHLFLSNNPIADESLCKLTKTLEAYAHLKILKLSGIKCDNLGASGIVRLVRQNTPLVQLDIIAIRMNGDDLIAALNRNLKIQQIICQGCGLTLEEEFNVEILLKRNRFIKENPYIGDITKTKEDDFNAFINRIKDPIYIKTLEDKEIHKECSRKKYLTDIETLNEKEERKEKQQQLHEVSKYASTESDLKHQIYIKALEKDYVGEKE
ncbi:uncharacterized protein LOC129951509 [Eupeodes corollae]|uniref:uncharacterized protein LOC129951509 n=1 Tax=Eupeodes corollae TaxID=290404 RepID=UPI0024922DB8|nr:uncharacterized protein LOC129951509 [Eupeodes corollae]